MTSRVFPVTTPLAPRTDFGPAPAGYIPGVGRGQTGFTTRSETFQIQLAEKHSKIQAEKIKNALTQATNGRTQAQTTTTTTDEDDNKQESQFDTFEGYQDKLWTKEDDDPEMNQAFDEIEQRVQTRKRKFHQTLNTNSNDNPNNDSHKSNNQSTSPTAPTSTSKLSSISSQFSDLKQNLANISTSEWENIPDVKDYSKQNAELKKINLREKFTALPDNILSMGINNQYSAFADQSAGSATPLTNRTTAVSANGNKSVDLTSIGRARDKMLSIQLDRMSDSVTGQSVVDPKGYLTSLSNLSSMSEVSDIKKARLLLKAVIQSNPSHGRGWIAASRLEKEVGNLKQAKQSITQALDVCQNDQDIWIEAICLHQGNEAKHLMTRAIKQCPTSVDLWLLACDLETNISIKKSILRRSLESIPQSIKLWKTAIELEESSSSAQILLKRACEILPTSTELWIALSNLQEYNDAKYTLNQARQFVPNDPDIWIAAAKIEEKHQQKQKQETYQEQASPNGISDKKKPAANSDFVFKIIQKAIQSLSTFRVKIDRDFWFAEAEKAETQSCLLTCRAIIDNVIALNVDKLDQLNTWNNDLSVFEHKSNWYVVKCILRYMRQIYPTNHEIWIRSIRTEKQHPLASMSTDLQTSELNSLMLEATSKCPDVELLWLIQAREYYAQSQIDLARRTLTQASEHCNGEEIWLAAVKLEFQSEQYQRADTLLQQARKQCSTVRIYIRSGQLYRIQQDWTKAIDILKQGIDRVKNNWKLRLMLAQIYTHNQVDFDSARSVYKRAIKECPRIAQVWIEYARFELHVTPSNLSSCRSILESALLELPQSDLIWLELIRSEYQFSNPKAAYSILSKALQKCPKSGHIWSCAIEIDASASRKSRAFAALKVLPEDALVFLSVAKFFWLSRKVAQARQWFQRATTTKPTLGDAYIYWLKFEQSFGDQIQQQYVQTQCVQAQPRYGDKWIQMSKSSDLTDKHDTDYLAILNKATGNLTQIFPGEIIQQKAS